MATTKKKRKAKRPEKPAERVPKSVPGTPREHRMIDAGKLRDDVEERKRAIRGNGQ